MSNCSEEESLILGESVKVPKYEVSDLYIKFDQLVYQEELAKYAKSQNDYTLFSSANYAGHMNGPLSKPHLDALFLAIPYNQNSVARESSPVVCDEENSFIGQISREIGYSNDSWGYVSTGGTISNLEGLWIARNKMRGQGGKPKYVFASGDSHYSLTKACDLLSLKLVPLEENPDIHPKKICAVVCTLGTTESGRVDNIPFWVDYCRQHKVHLHVDAAWGGYFIYAKDHTLLSDSTKQALNLLHEADSITMDCHKLGYAPYQSSVFLLKNIADTKYVNFTNRAVYIKPTSTSSCSIEGTRSGASISSSAFGHHILAPYYPEIIGNLLIGTDRLKSEIGQSKHFKLSTIPTDLCMILFHQRDSSSVNDQYLTECFCRLGNVQHDRLQLVSTTIEGQLYLRICVMDPGFGVIGNQAKNFVKKLDSDCEYYYSQFESYIMKRVESILSISEECDTREELENLVRSGTKIVAYNGFEPSGRIHIAQAIITVLNANLLVQNGCHVKLYIADWFAQLNHKMGGDLEKIHIVGQYFIEVFRACGIDETDVEFVWASDFITKNPSYWPRVLDISRNTTLKRVTRCCQIMGRQESESLSASQIIYPCMQVADIFEMGVDLPQLGVDQRKCNMLARDYAKKVKIAAPTAVSHHMLMGLKGKSAGKMSKSIPDSAIFMEDSESEVERKIMSSFCNDEVNDNPIFEYIQYIIIRWFGAIELNGHKYCSPDDLAADFKSLNKSEVKRTVIVYINRILDPVRAHFAKPEMRRLAELVAGFRTTR